MWHGGGCLDPAVALWAYHMAFVPTKPLAPCRLCTSYVKVIRTVMDTRNHSVHCYTLQLKCLHLSNVDLLYVFTGLCIIFCFYFHFVYSFLAEQCLLSALSVVEQLLTFGSNKQTNKKQNFCQAEFTLISLSYILLCIHNFVLLEDCKHY